MQQMILDSLLFVKDVPEKLVSAILNSPTQMLVTAMIVIVLTGMAGGMAAKKLKQPLILGYILAGVFVGIAYKAGFGDEANKSLSSLADIGVALLLFSMGLEFSKSDIKPVFKIAVWGSLAQVAFTLLAGTGTAYLLSKYYPGLFSGTASWLLFGTAFVSTSTAVILKTLTARRRMGTLSSKVMIGLSIVQDLTVIPIMLIVCKLDNLSNGIGQAVRPLFLGAVFMLVLMTVGAKYIPKWLRHVAEFESKEIFLFAVTGLALGIGMISEMMEVSFSFGAFLAGIVLSDSAYGKKALSEIMPVRDLFAMFFFVSIGMMLDVTYLKHNFVLVFGLMFVTSLSRTVFLSAVSRFSGYKNVIPVAMFFGMFPTSEIAFIVIQTGKTVGLFSESLYSLILCIVVCSMIVGPMFDSLTAPVYSFLRRTLWKNVQRRSDIPNPLPELRDHVIIAGGGQVARSIAHLLIKRNLPCLIIETDHSEFKKTKKDTLLCLYGDPQQEVILNGAGIANARLLLLAGSDTAENLGVVTLAKEINSKIPIVVRAESEDDVKLLHEKKIFEIVQSGLEAELELTRQALLAMHVPVVEIQNYLDDVRFAHYKPLMEQSDAFSASVGMRSFSGLVELNWILLPAASPFASATLAGSKIRSRFGVSVVGVLRDRKFLSNPEPGFQFCPKDILAVIGTQDEQAAFSKAAGSGHAPTPAAAEAQHSETDPAVSPAVG